MFVFAVAFSANGTEAEPDTSMTHWFSETFFQYTPIVAQWTKKLA